MERSKVKNKDYGNQQSEEITWKEVKFLRENKERSKAKKREHGKK